MVQVNNSAHKNAELSKQMVVRQNEVAASKVEIKILRSSHNALLEKLATSEHEVCRCGVVAAHALWQVQKLSAALTISKRDEGLQERVSAIGRMLLCLTLSLSLISVSASHCLEASLSLLFTASVARWPAITHCKRNASHLGSKPGSYEGRSDPPRR